MKYVLIHWTTTNETSILTDDLVRDKSMLLDSKKEGMVLFGKPGVKPPKSGWKAYLGRVLAVSDRRDIVYKKEKEFLGLNSPRINRETERQTSDQYEYTRSTKSKDSKRESAKRKISESSDGTGSDTHTDNTVNKKLVPKHAKKEAEREAYKTIIKNMETTRTLTSDSDGETLQNEPIENLDTCTNDQYGNILMAIKELQKELSHIRKENMELQKRLPKLVTEALAASNSNVIPNTKSDFGRKRLFSVNCPKRMSTPMTKSNHHGTEACEETPNNESQQKDKQCGEIEVSPSEAASSPSSNLQLSELLSSSRLAEIQRSPTDKKMTASLLLAVFGKKHISESSVTGRKQGDAECRPALDIVKVKLIIAHVLKHFPDKATEYTIKATMAQKCKDERRLMEARRIKAEKQT